MLVSRIEDVARTTIDIATCLLGSVCAFLVFLDVELGLSLVFYGHACEQLQDIPLSQVSRCIVRRLVLPPGLLLINPRPATLHLG